jgi:hypothetical protein
MPLQVELFLDENEFPTEPSLRGAKLCSVAEQ